MQALPSAGGITELSKSVRLLDASCPSSTLIIVDLVVFICIPMVENRLCSQEWWRWLSFWLLLWYHRQNYFNVFYVLVYLKAVDTGYVCVRYLFENETLA